MPPILYGIGEFYYEFLRNERKSRTKKCGRLKEECLGLLTRLRNRKYELLKLKNLLTQKLTFRLLLAFS